MESISIERLMQWKTTEGWQRYHTKTDNMHLKLVYDQIFIVDGETVIETSSLAGKLKGFCRNNVLILIVLTEDKQIRKVKFQFKKDPLKSLQILRNHFPIAGECAGKRFQESTPTILLNQVMKTALENCTVKEVSNMMTNSKSTENFLKLCLLDPNFPQFVQDTEKIVKKFK